MKLELGWHELMKSSGYSQAISLSMPHNYSMIISSPPSFSITSAEFSSGYVNMGLPILDRICLSAVQGVSKPGREGGERRKYKLEGLGKGQEAIISTFGCLKVCFPFYRAETYSNFWGQPLYKGQTPLKRKTQPHIWGMMGVIY